MPPSWRNSSLTLLVCVPQMSCCSLPVLPMYWALVVQPHLLLTAHHIPGIASLVCFFILWPVCCRGVDVGRQQNTTHVIRGVTPWVNAHSPPTAVCLLERFVDLQEGDVIVQNGANSSVGQAVIEIAASKGVHTVNIIRKRCKETAL